MSKESLCTTCTLPFCDEKNPGCAYFVQITRRNKKYWTKQNAKRKKLNRDLNELKRSLIPMLKTLKRVKELQAIGVTDSEINAIIAAKI